VEPRAVAPIRSRLRLCICGRCRRCNARARQARYRGRTVLHWRYWNEAYKYEHFQAIARDLYGPNANLKSCFPRPWEIPAIIPRPTGGLHWGSAEWRNPIVKPPLPRPREWNEPAPSLCSVPIS